MKRFKFFWIGGKTETSKGDDMVDAFRRLGYGMGAVKALDYWKRLTD